MAVKVKKSHRPVKNQHRPIHRNSVFGKIWSICAKVYPKVSTKKFRFHRDGKVKRQKHRHVQVNWVHAVVTVKKLASMMKMVIVYPIWSVTPECGNLRGHLYWFYFKCRLHFTFSHLCFRWATFHIHFCDTRQRSRRLSQCVKWSFDLKSIDSLNSGQWRRIHKCIAWTFSCLINKWYPLS